MPSACGGAAVPSGRRAASHRPPHRRLQRSLDCELGAADGEDLDWYQGPARLAGAAGEEDFGTLAHDEPAVEHPQRDRPPDAVPTYWREP